MDNHNAQTLARAAEIGTPADSVKKAEQTHRPAYGPRKMDHLDPKNLENKLRGMLLHGNNNNSVSPEAVNHQQQQPPRPYRNPQRQTSGSRGSNMRSQGPPSFTRNTTSPAYTGLLPSPNIQRGQNPPGLPRSNTHPAQNFMPQPPPGMDRAGSFHDTAPGSRYNPQYVPRGSHHSPRAQRHGQRPNGFRNANPVVPQMNNALHFPPLGSNPPPPTPNVPLTDNHVSPNLSIDTFQRHHGQGGSYTEKHHSPIYHHHHSSGSFDSTRQSPGYMDGSPQSRRGRPYHSHRGSFGGRSRRYHVPLDYTIITNYANQVVQDVSPTPDETATKSSILQRISDLCYALVPGSRIIPFGSLVSGFATKGADMDLIFVHDTLEPAPSSPESNIPIRLAGEFAKRGFEVDLLIKTRVPILKLKTPKLESTRIGLGEELWPENISCDIGFKAHLGITNSHFFRTYSQCDPRFSQMVLFIKQWSKNRDLNSPYFGTLSSYGYVLMVAHFLINVVQPPILPNLQLIPPEPGTPDSEIVQDGYNIWYYKDIAKIRSGELLPNGKNEMALGQLIYEFFQYYTSDFNFVGEVVTIRSLGGVMYKQQKGWTSAKTQVGELNTTYQDRYLLALEDPFETSHNVGRTCSTTGVRRIRNEMQRAVHMLRTLSSMQNEATTPTRNTGWEEQSQITIDDLMVTVRQNNGGFRNRKNNQKRLEEWIRNGWTVGRCLAQIDAASEEQKRKRELGLPDDAVLPPESDEGSEETDEEEEEEGESDSDLEASGLRLVASPGSIDAETTAKFQAMKMS